MSLYTSHLIHPDEKMPLKLLVRYMSLFECNLHAIPEGSDSASRLAFAAKRLGYEGIIISNHSFFIDILRPRAVFRVKGIDVAFGIEIVANNSKALRNCISTMRARYAFIAIHGGSEDINRTACEHPEVDVLLHPEEGRRVLSIAAARSAEQNQVAVAFDLSPLIRLRGITRARRLELIKRNIISEDCRTYSSSKVIHRWRGGLLVHPPQPAVNNFGSGEKDICEQNPFLPDHVVEHAGPGRRIPHSNVVTFSWRCSLRALRLLVKEYSEPFARKCKPAETNSYKSFFAAGPACSQTHQPQTI